MISNFKKKIGSFDPKLYLNFKNAIFLVFHLKFRNFFLTATDLYGNVICSISCGCLGLYKRRRDKTTRDAAIDLGRTFGLQLKSKGFGGVNLFFKSNFKNNRLDSILYGLEKTGFNFYKYYSPQNRSHNGLKLKKRKRK